MHISKPNEFLVTCIEEYSASKGMSGPEVIKLFEECEVIEYLQELYDILQTVSWEFVEMDIDEIIDEHKNMDSQPK